LVSIFNLFLLFLLTLVFTTLGGLGLLAADTSRTATTEGRGESKVNVLLGVETDHEGWNVDDLLADTIQLLVRYTCELNSDKNIPDVTLADQDTGMVDRLGKTELVDTGLETTLQEILNLQGQDVIELHAGLVEHTDTNQTTNQGITFEETLGVLLVESKKLTKNTSQIIRLSNSMAKVISIPSSTTNLGKGELNTPHLTLVAKTVLADDLQFGVTIEGLGVDNTT
jgi:hypothetical protein